MAKEKNKMDIAISYELRLTSCELADPKIESRPYICLYYDTHFERTHKEGGIVNIKLDEKDLTKVYRGTLTAKSHYRIPVTACLGMQQFAMRRNEFGMACYTNAGTAHVMVKDVIQTKGKAKTFELPLLMETTRIFGGEPFEKGKIAFSITDVKLGDALKFVPLQQCILGASYSTSGGQGAQGIAAEVAAFIKKRIDFEGSLADTWPGIKKVRAPMDISSAGVELLKTAFVPVEGFTLSEPLVVNAGYFQNAYERCMIRRNLDPEHDFELMNRARQAEVMAEVCAYAAQSFDYIGDTVDRSKRTVDKRYNPQGRIGFEDFSKMQSLSGDCEDGDGLTNLIFDALGNLVLNPKEKAAYPRIVQIQELASHYTYFGTLATVHGAKAEDNTEHIGAHMYGLLLPDHQLHEALATNEYGAAILSRLGGILNPQSSQGLPTLFCEGTGRIRPMGPGPSLLVRDHLMSAVLVGAVAPTRVGSHDPLIYERQIVATYLQRSKGGLKTEIPHDYGAPSRFYLGNLLLVTNRFIDQGGLNFGALICGQINPQTRSITRGAKFEDIINQQSSFALVPCEPMSQSILNVTREAVAIRAPCMPFVYDPKDPGFVAPNTPNPDLEWLKTSIANLRRPQGQAPYGSVDLFMRPHQFNRAHVKLMAAELGKIPVVYKVDYEMEHITSKVVTYRLRIFMDHEGVMQRVKR